MSVLRKAAIVCLGLSMVSTMTRADESKVPLGEVPPAGVEAVKAMFPAAEITGSAKETEDGKTVFEITLKLNGRTIDVTVGTDGKIQVVEKEIAAKDLPQAITRTLEAKYPRATYKIVEQVEAMEKGQLKLDFYEALLVTADQRKVEVQVTPDGKIKSEELKKPGDTD